MHLTTSAADLAARAHDAAAHGDPVLAVLGGDGSVSLAARALMESGGRTALAIFAAGTGNDLAKSIGAPVHDYTAMANLVERGTVKRIDAGTVDDIAFVNAAGFGFDAEVIARMMARGAGNADRPATTPSVRTGGGRLDYARAALNALWSYRGFRVRVDVPEAHHGTDAGVKRQLMLVFANGRSFGGAFLIAPAASLTDGALDMVSVGDASPSRRVALFARAVRGAHAACAEVSTSRGAAFVLTFDAPPLFEADGELHRARGNVVHVRCVPGALAVVAP